MNRNILKLYLVTDRPLAGDRDIEWIVKEAVEGGCTIVQLREKHAGTGEFVALAKRMKAALEPFGVPLIINDRIDVALAADADGIHIGQSDMPYEIARKLLGPDKIIGLSIETFEELEAANKLDVDYVAASPVFGTPTKTDTSEPWGLERLAEFNRRSVHPTVAIGGMNENTIGDVIACGTDGVAVVSAIVAAKSPREASHNLLEIINRNMKWSKEAWIAAENTFEEIIAHPFIQELAKGTLAASRFDRYIGQDEAYLGNYGRQMFAFAELLTNPAEKEMFIEFAKSGLEGEKIMHELLIERFGINTAVQPSCVTSAYNAHTEAAIQTKMVPIALAALLPCMWIYNEVGLRILQDAGDTSKNPYKEWIAEYGNEEFTAGVNKVLELADNYAASADADTRARMTREFVEGTRYEYEFWDWGYYGDEKYQ